MKSFFKFFGLTLLTLVFVTNVTPHVFAQSSAPKCPDGTLAPNGDVTKCCTPGPDGYCPLTALPGISKDAATPNVNINTYIPAVIKLIIGIAGALAVLRIMMGGIKYMTSDAFESKSDAKETINNALIGLLLAISAYIILYTLNPNLVTFKFNIAGLRVGAPISTNLGRTDVFCPDGTPATDGDVNNCGGVVIGPVVGCDNCVPLPSNVPRKTVNAGGCASPGPCVVNKDLGLLLGKLATALDGKVSWQVTEMFPPKVTTHVDLCHKPGPDAGKCVDAALTDGWTSDFIVSQFLKAIKTNVGPNFQYEIPCVGTTNTCTNPVALARKTHLSQLMGSGFKIVINTGATGEHAHINL